MKAIIPKNVTGHHFGSRCSKHAIRHHSPRHHTPPPTNLPCPCPGSCPRCLPVTTSGNVPSIQMESLTVYAERPTETSEYGHAFFTISDEEEESLTRGFYASCWLEGFYSLSDEIGMITIGVPGTVRDDTDHINRADESRHYTINSSQYGSARSFIESWESETPRYHLLTNNCADNISLNNPHHRTTGHR